MSAPANRPWPVLLLTALGAWLAAIPLLIAIGGLLGDTLTRGAGPYFVGTLVLGAAVVVLRSRDLPLFIEQLALPALLVGGGTLGMGVMQDLPRTSGALVLLAVTLALAAALPQRWLRVLLGGLAAGLLSTALLPTLYGGRIVLPLLWTLHALLAVWLLAQHMPWAGTRLPALVSPLAQGWLLTTLAGLAWASGTSFLVAGAVGANEVGQLALDLTRNRAGDWAHQSLQALSAALVLAAAAWGARAWPALKAPLPGAVALIVAVLAWFMPTLGAVLLALVVLALAHQWRLAAACALALAWIVGAFYYQLQWSLADKALLLLAAGAALGALAWADHLRLARSAGAAAAEITRPASARRAADARLWALLGGALLTLVVANGAIWQKENLIAKGTKVFVPLAPVDPRSLMQGDFMRLNFAALNDRELPLLADLRGQRPHLVMKLDTRGVASVQRQHKTGEALANDEMLLELTPKDGRWVVVTDAWFFKEGDAALWQAAKFGEFRVLPDGRALLVGMADDKQQALGSAAP